MLQGALHSGVAERRTIFEVFARHLPHGRRYGVVAGTGRLLDALERFRFDAADLDFLRASDIVDDVTLRYLESYRFTGNIWGYGEGDCYFPGSPILVVEGTFAEAVVLETITLSILNHDCAIASAASRMVTAAGGRPLIEMGSRRTHEQAAVASARAAYLVGFSSTSNLQANRRLRRPVGRDQRARVHPGARQRAARVPHPARRAGQEHDPAGGHVRRGPARCEPRSSWRAPISARCASTAATCRCWPATSARCWTSSARPTPGSCSPATWTNTRSRPWRPPRSTATGWARPGHRLRGADGRAGVQAGRARRSAGARWPAAADGQALGRASPGAPAGNGPSGTGTRPGWRWRRRSGCPRPTRGRATACC